MTSRHTVLPYRAGVGILVADPYGNVLLGSGAEGEPATCWRMPEGPIGIGDSEREAALGLLHGLTGWCNVRVLAEAPGWFTYELPCSEQGVGLGGLHCGQRLKWLAVRAPAEAPAETSTQWRWVEAAAVPVQAAAWKRLLYEDVIATFAPLLLAAPASAPAPGRAAAFPRP